MFVPFLAILLAATAVKKSIVILQNKGGGHGSIGFVLCKQLLLEPGPQRIQLVQEFTDVTKPPFSSYPDLEQAGIEVTITGKYDMLGYISKMLAGSKFDCVIDNWSKTTADISRVLSVCGPAHYTYISSAGTYNAGSQFPLTETDTVEKKGTALAEGQLMQSSLSYSILRPQYIYGSSKMSKRYLDYFISAAVKERPIPIPSPGDQLVCLTHVDDVVSMIVSCLNNAARHNQVFNCGTDRFVTYRGLCELVHQSVGNSLKDCPAWELFDPSDQQRMEAFPFRASTFITTPSKAKRMLGWEPKHRLQEDLLSEVQDFLYLHQNDGQ